MQIKQPYRYVFAEMHFIFFIVMINTEHFLLRKTCIWDLNEQLGWMGKQWKDHTNIPYFMLKWKPNGFDWCLWQCIFSNRTHIIYAILIICRSFKSRNKEFYSKCVWVVHWTLSYVAEVAVLAPPWNSGNDINYITLPLLTSVWCVRVCNSHGCFM